MGLGLISVSSVTRISVASVIKFFDLSMRRLFKICFFQKKIYFIVNSNLSASLFC